eukprot:m51a1_g12871 hypothetical protein (164) ;mRNA; r:741-1697
MDPAVPGLFEGVEQLQRRHNETYQQTGLLLMQATQLQATQRAHEARADLALCRVAQGLVRAHAWQGDPLAHRALLSEVIEGSVARARLTASERRESLRLRAEGLRRELEERLHKIRCSRQQGGEGTGEDDIRRLEAELLVQLQEVQDNRQCLCGLRDHFATRR